MTTKSVLVVGGGITGSIAAIALGRRGVDVRIVERSAQWHGVGHGITIQGNALKVFRDIGVLDAVLARGKPFTNLQVCHADGRVLATIDTPRTGGPDLPPTMGALRRDLQEVLLNAIGEVGIDVRLGTELEAFADAGEQVEARLSDGSTESYDLVIAADGIKSTCRAMLGMSEDRAPTGMGIWRVVTERTPQMDCASVYYHGPSYKAGYAPISDEQCYAYVLTDPVRPDNGLTDAEEMRRLLAGYHGNLDFVREQISEDSHLSFQPIEWLLVKGPWHRGRVIAIGDAVHACPPLIAQGAAQCAEDAYLLADYVTRDGDLLDLLAEFEARRQPRVSLVVEASLQLVEWEVRPDTPGADPAGLMTTSLAALTKDA